jgi:hypothetical protein
MVNVSFLVEAAARYLFHNDAGHLEARHTATQRVKDDIGDGGRFHWRLLMRHLVWL